MEASEDRIRQLVALKVNKWSVEKIVKIFKMTGLRYREDDEWPTEKSVNDQTCTLGVRVLVLLLVTVEKTGVVHKMRGDG